MVNIVSKFEEAMANGSTVEIFRRSEFGYEHCSFKLVDVYVDDGIIELSFCNGVFGISLETLQYNDKEKGYVSENNKVYTLISIHND